MNKFEAFVAACAASCVFQAGAPAAADLIIDTFDAPAGGQVAVDTTPGDGAVVSVLAGQPTIGGSREIFVDKTGPVGSSTPVSASSNAFGSGIFNFDQFSSTAQGSARLVYDGAANGVLNPTGLAALDVDLTQGGVNTGLLLTGLQVVGSGLTITANLYNAVTGLVYSSGAIPLINGYSGELFLPYALFTGPGGPTTPSDVGAIEVLVDGTLPGSDLTFEFVSSSPVDVPEPSSLVLLGLLGAVGGTGYYRRRKAAAAG